MVELVLVGFGSQPQQIHPLWLRLRSGAQVEPCRSQPGDTEEAAAEEEQSVVYNSSLHRINVTFVATESECLGDKSLVWGQPVNLFEPGTLRFLFTMLFTCFTVEWLLLIDPCFNVGDGELEVLVVIEPRAPITRCLMLAVMGGRWDSMAPLLQERTTKAQVLASLLRHKLGRMLLGDTDIIPRLRLDHLMMLNLTSTLLSGRLELDGWVGCSYILTS